MYSYVRSSSGSAGNAAAASTTISIPTGALEGDLLLAAIAAGGNPTVTWPTGYTEFLNYQPSVNLGLYIAWARYVPGTTGTSATFTSVFATNQCWCLTQVTGTPEVSAGNSTTTGANPPSLTASWGADDNGWIAVEGFLDGTRTVTTWPTGYGNQTTYKSTSASGTGVLFASKGTGAATEDPSAWTMSASARTYGCVVAVKGVVPPWRTNQMPQLIAQ